MTRQPDLSPAESVARLYDVFQLYQLDDFDPSTYCVSPEEHHQLASKPLQALGVSDLDRYARKAMTTWGTVNDFKHFLPRLLELSIDAYLDFTMPEVLLGKLADAHWTEWPTEERQAVRQFLDVFWLHHLSIPLEPVGDDHIPTVLGGLAEACGTVSKYLAAWETLPGENAALHLARFVDQVADEVTTTHAIRLWSESDQVSRELVAWLTSDAPDRIIAPHRATVEQAFPLIGGELEMIRAAMATWSR